MDITVCAKNKGITSNRTINNFYETLQLLKMYVQDKFSIEPVKSSLKQKDKGVDFTESHFNQIYAVIILGLLELIFGSALTVFSLGSGSFIGLSLIVEGANDLIFAIKSGRNKRFDWGCWIVQKIISLSISLICAGVGAVKDAFKTTVAGLEGLFMFSNFLITESIKDGWKMSAVAIGNGIAKVAIKEVIIDLIDYCSEKAIIPKIKNKIHKMIRLTLQNELLANDNIAYLLKIDIKNRDKYFQNQIIIKATEILNTRSNNSLLTIFGRGLVEGLAVNNIHGLSSVIMISHAAYALNELEKRFLNEFMESLNKEIENILKEQDKTQEFLYIEESDLTINRNDLCDELIDKASTYITFVIKGKLVTPSIRNSVSLGITSLFNSCERDFHNSLANYQAERRMQFFQNDDYNRIGEEYRVGHLSANNRKKANQLIQDVINGGEVGLPHLGALSNVIEKPIKILNENGQLRYIIGNTVENAIEVQYFNPNEENSVGHWTMTGGIEPIFQNTGKNNCLFNVIADHIGREPKHLRLETARIMNNNVFTIANQIDDIEWLRSYNKHSLIMGGAKYDGVSQSDAKVILDRSQGIAGYKYTTKAHPRGHTVNPDGKTKDDNVQNYSKKAKPDYPKSAFLTKEDQDLVAHYVLKSGDGQNAMNRLNSGGDREVVTINIDKLNLPRTLQMSKWAEGKQIGDQKEIKSVSFWLQHFKGQETNPEAPVQVFTAYPCDSPSASTCNNME